MIRTANIRTLKDKLSAYLKDVQKGDIVLVTDRGRVVAELRSPTLNLHALDEAQEVRQRLVESGVVRPGLPHDPDLYRQSIGVSLSGEVIDRALDWTRGER